MLFGGGFRNKFADAEFVEKGARDVGFTQFYNQKIRPSGIKMEALRLKSLRRFFWALRISLLVIFALILFFYNFDKNWLAHMSGKGMQERALRYLVFALIGAPSLWAIAICLSFQSKIKSSLCKNIISFFDGFNFAPEASVDSWDLNRFELLPYYEKLKCENLITGKYRDVELGFVKISAKIETSHEVLSAIYNGTVVKLNFNKQFKGHTLVKSDEGAVGNFLNNSKQSAEYSSLSRVELEDPEFEKIFQVFSSDQIEAKYLLTNSFLERLKTLHKFFGNDQTEACFYQESLILTFRNGTNLFEPTWLFTEVILIKECEKIIEQIGAIFDIIDILKLNEKTGL